MGGLPVSHYYVNTQAQSNGDHEVHEVSCAWMPGSANQQYLGEFLNCAFAVAAARRFYAQVNGCFYCSRACHTQ
jgi:hypothetical protein